jgi:hypothetical protein
MSLVLGEPTESSLRAIFHFANANPPDAQAAASGGLC